MILTYFKQAWQMLRQHKLFSGIYIAGTALAIAATTIFTIMYYVKIAPIYPEYNRSKTYYFDRGEMVSESRGQSFVQSNLSYDFARDHALTLKNAEVVSLFVDASWDDNYVSSTGISDIKVHVIPTDPEFFKIYEYEFTEGAPFSRDDLDTKARVAVISDDLAERTFGTAENVVGRDVILNFISYMVKGVVRAASPITQSAYADVFTPYTTYPGYDEAWMPNLGQFHAVILSDNQDGLKAEVEEIERRFNTSQDEYELHLTFQPKNHLTQTFDYFMNNYSTWDILKDKLLMLFVLLLVPALNLSGMISSRMDMRMSELGVRKSFGATRGALLSQVLWENLLLTVAGGLLGLIICWLILWGTSGSILTLINSFIEDVNGPMTVNADMLFSPWIFLICFALCVLLNLMSALIPAWISLRRPIVNSLKEK